MPNRISWIDYAKAIGIILVVYGHVTNGVMKAGVVIPLTIASILKRANIQFLFTPVRIFKSSGIFESPFRSLSKKTI